MIKKDGDSHNVSNKNSRHRYRNSGTRLGCRLGFLLARAILGTIPSSHDKKASENNYGGTNHRSSRNDNSTNKSMLWGETRTERRMGHIFQMTALVPSILPNGVEEEMGRVSETKWRKGVGGNEENQPIYIWCLLPSMLSRTLLCMNCKVTNNSIRVKSQACSYILQGVESEVFFGLRTREGRALLLSGREI
jgi:hypothetical protein